MHILPSEVELHSNELGVLHIRAVLQRGEGSQSRTKPGLQQKYCHVPLPFVAARNGGLGSTDVG